MTAITEAQNVYVGHDNVIQITLTENDVDYNLDTENVTKIKLDFGAFEVDSVANPTAIFWSGTILSLRLGNVTAVVDLADNNRSASSRLIVYTASNPNGVVWLDPLKFKIKHPSV